MSQTTITAAQWRAMHGLQPSSGNGGAVVAARGRARLPRPGRTYATDTMNQTEARYAGHLEALKPAGQVVAWAYEAVKLRLADKTFYTPDFLVIRADGSLELHEVKGHWEDDARVKIKVAARLHPWFRFRAVKAARGGRWEYEDFGRIEP